MECLIPKINIKIFYKIITCLSKLGEEACFKIESEQVEVFLNFLVNYYNIRLQPVNIFNFQIKTELF
jgi:hypothetical protein